MPATLTATAKERDRKRRRTAATRRTRVDDGDAADDVEVDDVGRVQLPQVQVAEPARKGEGGLPLVLQRCLVERRRASRTPCGRRPGRPACRSVIPGMPRATNGRKSLTTGCRRETSYISDDPYGSAGGEEVRDQQAVARARLVHERRRRRARAVEVEDDAGGVGPGVVAQERLRPEQAALLAVGEQEDDVVARRRARAQRAGGLEQRGDAAAVVGGAGRRGHGVVVRDEQDGTRWVTARQAADHVVDDAGHPRLARRDDVRVLHVRGSARAPRAGRDEVAHEGRPRRADGCGSAATTRRSVHGAGRRELGRPARPRRRPRRVPRRDGHATTSERRRPTTSPANR